MTNGTGPMPIANDLHPHICQYYLKASRSASDTYATKVIIAVLASATAPLSSPKPTASSDVIAPVAESDSSFLRPKRYRE